MCTKAAVESICFIHKTAVVATQLNVARELFGKEEVLFSLGDSLCISHIFVRFLLSVISHVVKPWVTQGQSCLLGLQARFLKNSAQ